MDRASSYFIIDICLLPGIVVGGGNNYFLINYLRFFAVVLFSRPLFCRVKA